MTFHYEIEELEDHRDCLCEILKKDPINIAEIKAESEIDF